MDTTKPVIVDGARLAELFRSAAQHLRDNAAAIDAINVYPVPDGDTGSNMAATLESAVGELANLNTEPVVSEVLTALARGALYGGRGNSGVILSQALKGLAKGVGESGNLDAAGLARGIERSASAAYAAVASPSEGTMLTVLRAAAEAATAAARALPRRGTGEPCGTILAEAVRGAEAAEAATPTQLRELAEAGVTDAGGEGICVILRGLLAALSGTAPADVSAPVALPAMPRTGEHDSYGHCTEFMFEPRDGARPPTSLSALLDRHGAKSVVLVGGDGEGFRVHAHLENPQALIDAVSPLGRVLRLKVDDMDGQHVRFAASGSGATAKLALLALSPGPGFDRVFASLGARTAPLSLSRKPSAGEIAAAAEELGAPDVVVLPNHKNVLLAAQQAGAIARCTLHVVPTEFVPAGVAAAMAFDAGRSPGENFVTMRTAAAAIRTVEVTFAARHSRTEGLQIPKGATIALVDGRLSATAFTALDALIQALDTVGAAGSALITVYGGAGATPASTGEARDALERAFPAAEIEMVEGGQTLYPFIASVEV